MLALMAVAAVVTVVQLGLVGSWARSVRLSTLVQAVAVGLVVVGPATVAVEWALVRLLSRVGPWAVSTLVTRASWTWDPVVEEVMKVAPLLVLAVVWPSAHRQLGWTDHLLVGAGLGVGFGLAESAFRFAQVGPMVMKIGDDYMVGASLMGGAVTVPSVGTSLGTWLPDTTPHLLYTCVAVLGVAWAGRRRGWWRLLGVLPIAAASLAHAVGNAGGSFLENAGRHFADTPLARTTASATGWLYDRLTGVLLVSLIVLVVVDRVAQAQARRAHRGLLLPGEAWHGLAPVPLVAAGLRAVPWSTWATWYVVLQRRAGLYALAAGCPPTQADTVGRQVASLSRATDPVRWRAASRKVLGSLSWRGLWSWRTFLWLVAVAPAVAYLVIGGFPSTRGLQQRMTGPVGTGLLVAGLVAGTVVALSQVSALVKNLRASRGPVWHEAAIRPAARLATITTTVLVAAALVARLVAVDGNATRQIVRNYHILDALAMAALVLGLALLLMAFITIPPMALAVTSVGLVALEGSVAVSAGYLAAGTLTLAASAMLNQAAENPPPDTGGEGRSTGRTTPGGANEERAMDLVKENPEYGDVLPVRMKDPEWPAQEGWVKMSQTIDDVEVHYVHKTGTDIYKDFKFKDWSGG